ncbi:hypothetical protein EN856_01470 [Mesorhizobium sp. M8A.F.Ca.ET.213.01.1.1]|nr:hypothetical protein EN856_01470 [Mesorhizobium sp. M8A.F.Ca.ET.213.01.1.1]
MQFGEGLDLKPGCLCRLSGIVGDLASGLRQAEHSQPSAAGGGGQARAEQGDAFGDRRELVAEIAKAGGELVEIRLGRRRLHVLEGLLAGGTERLELVLDRVAALEGDALRDCFVGHVQLLCDFDKPWGTHTRRRRIRRIKAP